MTATFEEIKKLYKQLNNGRGYSFKELEIAPSDSQGVYVILDVKGTVLHVGKTSRAKKGLRQRLNNHLRGQSSFAKKFLKQNGKELREGYIFKYIIVDDSKLRTLLEAYAIGCLCPEHLGTGAID